MKISRRQFLHLATGAAVLPTISRFARAQTYPTRPITIVVTFPAGSAMDTAGRIVGERMRLSLGQPVIIDNISGANGSIGAGRVARAAGDGYTIVMGLWNTHVANGALYRLSYDLLTDFEPISLLVNVSYLIVAKKTMPANDLQGLIAWLKANPDMATEGTSGVGSSQHVGGLLFQRLTGTRFGFVPYRSSSQAMPDLVAGRIDWTMALATDVMPQLRSGNIKAYATTATSSARSCAGYPDCGRGGIAGILSWELERDVGTEADAEGRHRQAQRGRRGHLGRFDRTSTPCGNWAGSFPARAADAGSARRFPEI